MGAGGPQLAVGNASFNFRTLLGAAIAQFMTNNRTKPDNPKPTRGSSRPPQQLALAAIAFAFFGYILVFLTQPSIVVPIAEQTEPVSRYVDLLLLPTLATQFFGDAINNLLVFFDRLPVFLAAACWLGLAFWLGRPFVIACVGHKSAPAVTRIEILALAILVGLALLSTLTLCVGLFGGLGSRMGLLLVVGAAALASTLWQRRLLAADVPGTSSRPQKASKNSRSADTLGDPLPAAIPTIWAQRLVPVATCAMAGVYLLSGAMPAMDFDVLEYHLQAPKEFQQAGAITFVEHNVYSNMPLGSEMHSLAAMTLTGGESAWWLGGLIGKTLIASYSLIAALLLGGWVARKFSRVSGWAAAGLFLASPGNIGVSTSGLIDMVLAAYVLAAIWVLIWIVEQATDASQSPSAAGEAHPGQLSDLLLLMLLVGGAAACKYPGVVFCLMPAVGALIILQLRGVIRFKLPHIWAATAIGLGLTCAGWYLKNVIFTGNPVYPLMSNVFGGLDAEHAAQWQRAHRPGGPAGETPYSPGQMLDSLKAVFLSSPFVNPSIMFLAVVGAIAAVWPGLENKPQVQRWSRLALALVAWIFVVWWLATHRIDRFWLPCLPPLVMLAIAGARLLAARVSVGLAAGIVFVGVGYGTMLALSTGGLFVPLGVLRAELKDTDNTGRVSRTIAWCNQVLDQPGNQLLLIGEARGFQFEPRIVYATCFNETPGQAWLEGLSPEQQRENLLEHDITHIVVDWIAIARYRSPGNYGFSQWPQASDIEALIANGVVRRLGTEFSAADFEVLEVIQQEPLEVAASGDDPEAESP